MSRGNSLIELLVVTVILSVIATITMPYASMVTKRNKEVELKQTLIHVRRAIDQFHIDWSDGKLSKFDSQISKNGYPTSLKVLIEGVDGSETGTVFKYLRRMPRNPFFPSLSEEEWKFRGYLDNLDSTVWNGEDVYDVSPNLTETALDGTQYEAW